MNPSRRLRILMAGLALVAATVAATTQASTAVHDGTQFGPQKGAPHPGIQRLGDHDGDEPIVGTWITVVTPTGDGAPPPFPQLLTFNEGGTAIFSAAGPPVPALGNPGHGVWKKIGHRKYAATFVQLTFDGVTDPAPLQLNGSLKLSLLITLGAGHTITTVDEATIYDPDGNAIVTLGGTETGKRLKVDVIH